MSKTFKKINEVDHESIIAAYSEKGGSVLGSLLAGGVSFLTNASFGLGKGIASSFGLDENKMKATVNTAVTLDQQVVFASKLAKVAIKTKRAEFDLATLPIVLAAQSAANAASLISEACYVVKHSSEYSEEDLQKAIGIIQSASKK